jgi:hydroxymethylglutaryl-CoA reductase
MWPSTRTWRSGTTTHGGLVEVQPHVFGRRVFAQFVFGTGDAMGLTHEWAAEWN